MSLVSFMFYVFLKGLYVSLHTVGLFAHKYGGRGDCSIGGHILGLSLSPTRRTTVLLKINKHKTKLSMIYKYLRDALISNALKVMVEFLKILW